MRILFVNTFESIGGAARSAYRLHKGLLNNGVDSKYLVAFKNSSDQDIIGASNKTQQTINKIRNVFDQIRLFRYPNRKKLYFLPR